ncbi:MAG: hypothetical protein V1882_00465 [Candidatus Omnitrophota bacterium]
MIINIATPKDDDELLAFLRGSYPTLGWSEDVFRWQYYENPSGPIHHWVGRANGRIVASFAVAPHPMRVFQHPKIGWRPQDLLISPEYRGLGLYPALTQKLNAFLDNPEYPLNFTFPNPNSHRGFVKSGWKLAFPFPLWTIDRLADVPDVPVNIQATRIEVFDIATDRIWGQYSKGLDLMIERSARHMNWRYFSNPKSKYSVFKLSLGADEGVIVLKYYDREDGTRWCHICDLFCATGTTELFEGALRYAIGSAKEHDCNALSVWYAAKPGTEPLFARNHFLFQKDLDRWVALYVHEDQIPGKTYCSEPRWHLTMGDSDVY